MSKLRVTLKRSGIGRPEDQRRTLVGLGLTKMNKTVEVDNSPAMRGMVKKVMHLVKVEEVD